jgi:signal peptidase II
VLVVVVDQISKAWARGVLSPGREVSVISGWLWYRLITNSGATLGLLQGHNLIFLLVSAVVVAAVVMVVLRGAAPGALGAIALGAVAGGATSNVIDRLRLGAVVDFIEVHLWPTTFNLADAAIRIGVVLFVLALLLDRARRGVGGGGAAGR